ncbi:WD40 repeat domain-containing serine/threonine protein kinase [Streptomyces flavochromogenes]|uniref:WD40 repeat domain-containing serine/threonine protein kinase n=1 Tax=Streptomyces flavochromogenes TaxID=68199 RepID=UPI00099D8F23|nr:serine/threonine-protein kinase [Streptomyces flavochromogenes]
MTSAAGELVSGRYRLVEAIGRGGMGRVWRAHDDRLDREVAVKEVVVPDDAASGLRSELIARTEREARAAARLRHPGVVAVHDVVHHRGVPWIVMEFVAGPSLGELVRTQGRLGWERVADLGVGIADALAHAHAAGVVHRDLKPDNVLLAGDRPVIADFGIARLLDATQQLTATHTVIGTPQFMPPEQLEGRRVEAPADLWALGATLYAAVEGRPPFDGPTLTAVITAVLTQPAPASAYAGPLAELLGGLLEKDPAARPDARAAAKRLRALRGTAGGPEAPARTPTVVVDVGPAPDPAPDRAPAGISHGFADMPTAPAVPDALEAGPRRADPPGPRRRSVLLGGLAALAAAGGASALAMRQFGGDDAKASPPWTALTGALSPVRTLAFSPDGTLLAGGCQDRTVRIWDVAGGTLAATLEVPPDPARDDYPMEVREVRFSPDGRTLATGTNGPISRVHLWDVATRTLTRTLERRGPVSYPMAFRPDSRMIATDGDGEVLLWDAATGALTGTAGGDWETLTALAFSPDGKALAIGDEEGTLRRWEPGSGSEPAALKAADSGLPSVAFTPDGSAVISGGDKLRLHVRTDASITQFGTERADWVMPSPDGLAIASVAYVEGSAKLLLWSTATRTVTGEAGVGEGLGSVPVALSPDWQRLATGGDGNSVRLWPFSLRNPPGYVHTPTPTSSPG